RQYSFDGEEPSTATLIAVARDIGLEAVVVSLDWRDLGRIKNSIPAVLRLKDGTSIVIEGINSNASSGPVLVVREPAKAHGSIVTADESRLRHIWSGEIILLKRRFFITDSQRPFGLKWLAGQLLREKRLFLDIVAGSLATTLFALAPPFMLMIV